MLRVCSTCPFYCHCYSSNVCHEQTDRKWSSWDCVAHPANRRLSSKFFFSHPCSLLSLLVTLPILAERLFSGFYFPPGFNAWPVFLNTIVLYSCCLGYTLAAYSTRGCLRIVFSLYPNVVSSGEWTLDRSALCVSFMSLSVFF